jgi:hypothetical protein
MAIKATGKKYNMRHIVWSSGDLGEDPSFSGMENH